VRTPLPLSEAVYGDLSAKRSRGGMGREYLFNVDHSTTSFDCCVSESDRICVAGKDARDLRGNFHCAVTNVNGAWIIIVNQMDLRRAWIVVEIDVVKDD